MSRDILWAGIAVGVLTVVVAIAFLVPGAAKPAEPKPAPYADSPQLASDPFAQPYSDPFAPAATTPSSPMGLPPIAPPITQPPVSFDPMLPTGVDPFAPVSPQVSVPTGPADPAPVTSDAKTHTVVKGDLLGDISRTYYGTSRNWKLIAAANPGANPDNLKVGSVLTIPPAPGATAKPDVAPTAGEGTYVVQKGDSYHIIAKKVLGATSRWKEIEDLNKIPPGDLKIGQSLRMPSAAPTQPAAPVLGAPALDAGTPPAPAGGRTHVVGKGEYLSDISKNYYGTTRNWQKIASANPGVNPNNLKVGQKLVIPDLADAAPAPVGGAPAVPVAGSGTYTVVKGDQGGDIARKTLGSARRWPDIAAANPGIDATKLKIGQVLQIPGGVAAQVPGSNSPDLRGAAPTVQPVVEEFRDPFLDLPASPTQPTSPAGTPAPPQADPFRF